MNCKVIQHSDVTRVRIYKLELPLTGVPTT